MSRLVPLLWLVPAVCLPPALARAGEPTATVTATSKAPPERVHLGATSVTVVDEHEPVDDVISRIRNRKPEPGSGDKVKGTGGQSQGTGATHGDRRGGGHTDLRTQRDRATANDEAGRLKDEKRDRTVNARSRLDPKQRR